MFTIENWGNLQLLIDFRWLKFAKCHMTHPTVQRHGDFQSQMAIAVQLKQKRKKNTLPKQGWGVVASVVALFSPCQQWKRRQREAGVADGWQRFVCHANIFRVFPKCQKACQGSKSNNSSNNKCVGNNNGNCQARYTLCCFGAVVVVNVSLMRKVYTRLLRNCDLFCIFKCVNHPTGLN